MGIFDMRYLEPSYTFKETRATSPTYWAQKVLPADSAFHPWFHKEKLIEEETARKKEIRDKEKEEEWNRIRQSISDNAYKPLSATKNMSKGGRTRPVDGCAIKGKTKPPVF